MAIRAIETGYQEVDSCSSKLPSQKGFHAKGSCSVDDLKDLRLRDDFRERDYSRDLYLVKRLPVSWASDSVKEIEARKLSLIHI